MLKMQRIIERIVGAVTSSKGRIMIVAVIAASLATSAALVPRKSTGAAPCHAVPLLCIGSGEEKAHPPAESQRPSSDTKMSAYRFDARPCRVIGNMGCPKQARLKLFRLGEPLRETLLRSFGPR